MTGGRATDINYSDWQPQMHTFMFDVTRKHDLTLHFPERPHSERVAEDVMADLYPAFVFLLLPLCHLLRYRQLGSLARSLARCAALLCGAVGVLLVCCLWGSTEGRGQFWLFSPRGITDDLNPLLLRWMEMLETSIHPQAKIVQSIPSRRSSHYQIETVSVQPFRENFRIKANTSLLEHGGGSIRLCYGDVFVQQGHGRCS